MKPDFTPMIPLIRFLYLTAISLWVGSMVFFSCVAAPAVFRALTKELAGDVIAVLIGRYYKIGLVLGAVALLSSVYLIRHETAKSFLSYLKIVMVLAMLALTFYTAFAVHPKIKAIKAEMRAKPTEHRITMLQHDFNLLHRQSVTLNVVTMGLGLMLLLATSVRNPF